MLPSMDAADALCCSVGSHRRKVRACTHTLIFLFLPAGASVWHAGDRSERLAAPHHLPPLHQDQQADRVVLAGP